MFSESPQLEILSPPPLASAVPPQVKETSADILVIQKQALLVLKLLPLLLSLLPFPTSLLLALPFVGYVASGRCFNLPNALPSRAGGNNLVIL